MEEAPRVMLKNLCCLGALVNMERWNLQNPEQDVP